LSPLVRNSLFGAAALFLAIQVVPVERSNPPVEEEVPAPPEVLAVLKRSCYDCHSNETRWPWYSHVAPASWLVANDVHHARKHLNFTAWNRYSDKKRRKKLHEAWEQVEEGEMPLWFYLPLHPGARLSDADRRILHEWTRSAAAKPTVQKEGDS
jgi:Haem-binding domain